MAELAIQVADGNVSLDRLVELIVSLQKLIEKLQKQNIELQEKIDGKNPTERLDEQYSEKAEAKRQAKGKKRKQQKPQRQGRIATAEKIAKPEQRKISIQKASVPNNASSPTPELFGGSKTVGLFWLLTRSIAPKTASVNLPASWGGVRPKD